MGITIISALGEIIGTKPQISALASEMRPPQLNLSFPLAENSGFGKYKDKIPNLRMDYAQSQSQLGLFGPCEKTIEAGFFWESYREFSMEIIQVQFFGNVGSKL